MTVLLMALVADPALAQDPNSSSDSEYAIDMSRGTLQVGGLATANIAFIDENPDVFLIISPSGGLFVADRTLVYFDVDLLVDEVEGFDAGVSVGLDQFFPGQWIAPYIGIGAGYGTRQLDDAPSPYSFPELNVFSASGRAGLLLPASQTLGVDIGFEVNVNFGFGDSQADAQTWVTVPIGYTGVRAFF